jgi:hypothetical protein
MYCTTHTAIQGPCTTVQGSATVKMQEHRVVCCDRRQCIVVYENSACALHYQDTTPCIMAKGSVKQEKKQYMGGAFARISGHALRPKAVQHSKKKRHFVSY